MSASSTAISKTTALEDIPTPDNVAPLFQPVTVGQFDLKVRAVYAPLTRCRAIGAIPHPSAAKYYSDRTSAGQLIISEATGVTESVTGYGYPNTPGLYSKEQIEAWKPIVKAVHDKEGVFFAQIWHTGRASHPAYEFGKQPVSSSAIAISDGQVFHPETFETFPYPEPRALETDEIPQYVDWFRQGARNAIEAGFDGVEIHATNGYLINQFLDDGVNKRTDKYGGSIENRCRFCLEIVEAVTKEIGSDRVGIRLGAFHAFNDCADSDPYNLYSYLIEKLNDYNLAYMHIIDAKVQGNEDRATVSDSIEPFVKLCKTKVIVAGGVIDRDGKNSGPEQIASGKADLVCYGRWALANPDMLKRFKLGAPLNKYDRSTFYMPDPVKGYNDYPYLEDTEYGKEYFSDA